jgi:hypothetical protein
MLGSGEFWAGGFVGKKKSTTQRRKGAKKEKTEAPATVSAASPRASAPLRDASAWQRPAIPADEDLSYISPDLRALAVPIDLFQPDPQNENKHDDRSIRAIAASLRELGQRSNISGNVRGMVIAKGNGTWRAAKSLGWEYIALVATDDDDDQHAAYRIADNRTAQFSDFDEELLQRGLLLMKDKTPDLFLDLELAELEGKTAGQEESKEVEVKTTYALLVELPSEAAQKKYFDKWTKEGFSVQVRTI